MKTFAFEGPSGLKVERLAKTVNKNKSSFYHFFADLDVFTQRLLRYHLEQAKIIVDKESKAQNEKELSAILIEYKLDLLFNRQLRIHRENRDFMKCFFQINELSIAALLPLWKKIIGLEENNYLAKMVLMLSIENFYLQVTYETLNEVWLGEYFDKIKQMVNLFKKSNSVPVLDAPV